MVEHERERKGNINPHLAGSEFDPLFLSLHFLLLLGSAFAAFVEDVFLLSCSSAVFCPLAHLGSVLKLQLPIKRLCPVMKISCARHMVQMTYVCPASRCSATKKVGGVHLFMTSLRSWCCCLQQMNQIELGSMLLSF